MKKRTACASLLAMLVCLPNLGTVSTAISGEVSSTGHAYAAQASVDMDPIWLKKGSTKVLGDKTIDQIREEGIWEPVWETSRSSVVKIVDQETGKIEAVGKGEATITVSFKSATDEEPDDEDEWYDEEDEWSDNDTEYDEDEPVEEAPKDIKWTVYVWEREQKVENFHPVYVTDTTAQFAWEGTSEDVYIQVIRVKNNELVHSAREDRKYSLSNLEPETQYEIRINGEKQYTFWTRTEDDDNYYEDKWYDDDYYGYDVDDFEVDRKSDEHVEISWTGTSKKLEVELKKKSTGRIVDTKYASRKTMFSDLDPGTEYSVYIDGVYAGSFRTENSYSVHNVSIKKDTSSRSVEISWEGTSGTVEAALRKNDAQIDTKWTSEKKVKFYNVELNKEYGFYIEGKYVQSFMINTDVKSSQTTWQPPLPSNMPSFMSAFSDTQMHWAKEAVQRLASHGIVQGFADGSFKPDKQVSREEFIVMLMKTQAQPTEYGNIDFSDVQSQRWSAPYISAAVKNGIIQPKEYANNIFLPQKTITREEAAVMLARALKMTSEPDSLLFTDTASIKNKGLVGAIIKEGIMVGLPNNRFNPNGSLTRAAAAVIINEIFKTY